MTPDHWRQVKNLLQSVLEQPPQQQAAYLAAACAGNQALKSEVESLIEFYKKADNFLESPAFPSPANNEKHSEAITRQAQESKLLRVDAILQNRYIIARRIGQGGMGAVYEAKDQRLGATVALKQIIVDSDPLRKAFQREARLLAKLRHPALPVVSDHFIENGEQFLAMQFIAGEDLAELLRRNGRSFDTATVLRWGDQLLDALEYLQMQSPSVIHRDIKPNNLKLNENGNIILLDFGLAKSAPPAAPASSTTTSNSAAASIAGFTPHYAPLEQIEGAGTDARSDIYALAATLYHLMTGIKPPDAMKRALALINGQPDPLQPANLLNPAIPKNIAGLLQKAMSQQADQRPANAAEMRRLLKAGGSVEMASIEVGQPEMKMAASTAHISAPATMPAMQPLKRRHSSYKFLALALMAAMLLALLLPIGNWLKTKPPSNNYPQAVAKKEFGEPGFEGDPISVDIENVQVYDLLRFFSDNYGINFVADASVPKKRVTMKVSDVPWGTALESVLRANNLTYKREGKIIRVYPIEPTSPDAKNRPDTVLWSLDNR
jgi:serine/threonine protein kinase